MKNSATRKKQYNRSYGRVYYNFKTREEPKLLQSVEKRQEVSVLNDYRLDVDGEKIWSF